MNNDRTVVITNIGDCPIGLADTQSRMYRLAKNAKMRISRITLQDILDHPGSRRIFNQGRVMIGNITADELFDMGLNDSEIELFLDKKTIPTPVVVIAEEIEEEEEEIVEEPVKEVKEEIKKEVKEVKTTANNTKKPNAKKAPAKKTSKK